MGFLDKFKGKNADEVVDRAKEQAAQHDEDIDAAIDKVADLADKATDGKFTEKIDEAAAKLKEAADQLDDDPKA
ncbi:MAG: antitoxin [Aeromicrobium sp.]